MEGLAEHVVGHSFFVKAELELWKLFSLILTSFGKLLAQCVSILKGWAKATAEVYILELTAAVHCNWAWNVLSGRAKQFCPSTLLRSQLF